MLTLAALAFNCLIEKDDFKVYLSRLLEGNIRFLYEIINKNYDLDIDYYLFEGICIDNDTGGKITAEDIKREYHILKYKIIKYVNRDMIYKTNELDIIIESISKQLNIDKSVVYNCISCQSINDNMNDILIIREIIRRAYKNVFC